jgi:hypothetical protein
LGSIIVFQEGNGGRVLFGVSVLRYPKSKDPTSGEEKDHIDDLG